MNADFTGAAANGVELGVQVGGDAADMRGANLQEADLSDARIVDVDLSDADLTRTVLSRADMRASVLSGATLQTYLGDVANLPPDVDRAGALAAPPPPPPSRRCPDWSAPRRSCQKTGLPIIGWIRCWLERPV